MAVSVVSAEVVMMRRSRRRVRPVRCPPDGETGVLFAVLEDAISVILTKHPHEAGRHDRLRREAMEWMTSGDRRHAFAFENICDALDIDAARLRQGVMEEAGLAPAWPQDGPARAISGRRRSDLPR